MTKKLWGREMGLLHIVKLKAGWGYGKDLGDFMEAPWKTSVSVLGNHDQLSRLITEWQYSRYNQQRLSRPGRRVCHYGSRVK